MNLFSVYDEPTAGERTDGVYTRELVHPYSRYGYAVALYRERLASGPTDEAQLRGALIFALEEGLEQFRMETTDNPKIASLLRYQPIRMSKLQEDPKLVQGSLARLGKYLYPTVITDDRSAKDTFDSVCAIVSSLRSKKTLLSSYEFKRSFAPTVSKINNGDISQKVPRGTLLEAACAAVTAVTPFKPASSVGKLNTTVLPDLPNISELYDFIELFDKMLQWKDEGKQRFIAKMPEQKVKLAGAVSNRKKKEGVAVKSEYRRPPIFSGNYPFAPRDAEYFGAAGLLGAIGYWAVEAKQVEFAEPILESLVKQPLYIVSYDSIIQTQFDHHIIGLAENGNLYILIRALTTQSLVGADEFESGHPSYNAPMRKLFAMMTSRFLQSFSRPAFRDFLAFRARYPHEVQFLLEEYFMDIKPVKPEVREIVQSAGEYGKWLNRVAYLAARSELGDKLQQNPDDYARKLRKEKAKILTVFESVAMSAKRADAMIAQVSTQAGRLMQGEAPAGVKRFVDAVNTGEIEFEDGRHLLMAYMRLQSPVEKKIVDSTDSASQAAEDAESNETTTEGDSDGS